MQNRVHRTRDDALGAARGTLTLAACRTCAFAWNRTFDPGLLVYDDTYDNAVPSAVMDAYYREVAAHLAASYPLDGGPIVDVGCGDGRFLRTICELEPGATGLGVDPALPADRAEGRITLVKGMFGPDDVTEAPSLVVSRHVLEHIPDPVAFLATIRVAVERFGPTPAYFEVPDLGWIVAERTFWDFCYEHCNYFTAASFDAALEHAGLAPRAHRTGFEGQYLWVEATAGGERPDTGASARGVAPADALVAYADGEQRRVAATRTRLRAARDAGSAVVVWGMATKGVLFSLLVDDADDPLIDRCVDVNVNKQGCFVPVSGQPIEAPEALRAEGRPVTVVAMNANYVEEIRASCAALGVDAVVRSATELEA
jgi:hypothetical protein